MAVIQVRWIEMFTRDSRYIVFCNYTVPVRISPLSKYAQCVFVSICLNEWKGHKIP